MFFIFLQPRFIRGFLFYAGVVELGDTPHLGCGAKAVQVRCLSPVQCPCDEMVNMKDLKSFADACRFDSCQGYNILFAITEMFCILHVIRGRYVAGERNDLLI